MTDTAASMLRELVEMLDVNTEIGSVRIGGPNGLYDYSDNHAEDKIVRLLAALLARARAALASETKSQEPVAYIGKRKDQHPQPGVIAFDALLWPLDLEDTPDLRDLFDLIPLCPCATAGKDSK